MSCTVQIFMRGEWLDCCTVQLESGSAHATPQTPAILQYLPAYCDLAQDWRAAVSVQFPVRPAPYHLPHWPGFLLDMLPQGAGREFLLEKLGMTDESASVWDLLKAGAFNPVGRLRIREAVAFQKTQQYDCQKHAAGFSLEEILSRSDAFQELMECGGQLTGGLTSLQGDTPKFMLTQGKDGCWYVDGMLPDEASYKHYLVKISRARDLADWKILEAEAPYMRVAQEMGLSVTQEMQHYQQDMLFVPRFDRELMAGKALRYHQESLVSLANLLPGHTMTHQQALFVIRRYVHDPYAATLEYLKRDILNQAMGNTDTHPANTSIQMLEDGLKLAPLYDFAPTYLDQDAAEGNMIWADPEGNELLHWKTILPTLALEASEGMRLKEELSAFAEQLRMLEDCMRVEGVKTEIVEGRYYSIQSQIAQLRSLS